MIYLISTVRAEESLDSLVSFVDKARLGEDGKELYSTLAVLRSFKLPTAVYETVERLADSPNFDDGYLFALIGILVNSQPSNARNILEKFESRIKQLWNSLPDDVKERRAFLEEKEDCLRQVSKITEVAQYEDTWLTRDYRLLDKA